MGGLFPNESSLLRLVTGVIIEISEEWETGKVHLQPETKKQQPNQPSTFSFSDLNQKILQIKNCAALDGPGWPCFRPPDNFL